MEELTATVRDATLRAEAARMKVESLKEEILKKKALNMLKFPPFIALAVVFVSKIIGHSLPTVVHKLAEPLANANNPLVLITVGVLFEAGLRRQQTRDCIGFLAAKYATGLACAAVVSVFIPSGFPIARGTLSGAVRHAGSICCRPTSGKEQSGRRSRRKFSLWFPNRLGRDVALLRGDDELGEQTVFVSFLFVDLSRRRRFCGIFLGRVSRQVHTRRLKVRSRIRSTPCWMLYSRTMLRRGGCIINR